MADVSRTIAESVRHIVEERDRYRKALASIANINNGPKTVRVPFATLRGMEDTLGR